MAMSAMLGSVRVIDLVLAVIALEACLLLGWRVLSGHHLLSTDVYPNLIAAAGLLGAAHVLLTDGDWLRTGTCLLVAMFAHIVALARLWRVHQRRHWGASNTMRRVSTIQTTGDHR
jgi:hypothetical protein